MDADAPNSCWTWQPETPARLEQPVWLLRLEGPDARRFLHGQSSQAIELAAPGSVLATCLISPTARMRALAWVLVDAGGVWLVIEAGEPEAVRAGLDRVLFPADQVQLGPLQPALLITPLGDTTLPQPGPGRWLLEHRLLLAPPTTAHPLAGSRLLSPAEHERWRIQQGWPTAPGELNDNTNPFELGLAPRVSLSKGCYVGQETLAKLATYDGVKQQLRRWCWQPPSGFAEQALSVEQPLSTGQSLLTAAGERAGAITSVLQLPPSAGGLWIGLALVRRSALDEPRLSAGEQIMLELSLPDSFVAPPSGPGQSAGQSQN